MYAIFKQIWTIESLEIKNSKHLKRIIEYHREIPRAVIHDERFYYFLNHFEYYGCLYSSNLFS
jgi:tricorn protease-like protein